MVRIPGIIKWAGINAKEKSLKTREAGEIDLDRCNIRSCTIA